MSDSSPNQDTAGEKPKSGILRKLALYALLLIMIAAIIYDYRVARPSVNAAYDEIAKASVTSNTDGTKVFTNETVRELMGREPDETFNDGMDLVEVYHFKGGLPLRPHRLWTVFKKNGDNHLFYRHAKFAYEASNAVSPINEIMVSDDLQAAAAGLPDGYGEEMDAADEGGAAGDGEAGDDGEAAGDGDAGGGGEARGGGGPRGGGEGGDRPGLKERFAEWDADGDGKLAGEEIPERMAESLGEIDTDGNGEVSLEEAEARFAAMRNQRGGPGGEGRGGEGRGGEGRRTAATRS